MLFELVSKKTLEIRYKSFDYKKSSLFKLKSVNEFKSVYFLVCSFEIDYLTLIEGSKLTFL